VIEFAIVTELTIVPGKRGCEVNERRSAHILSKGCQL